MDDFFKNESKTLTCRRCQTPNILVQGHLALSQDNYFIVEFFIHFIQGGWFVNLKALIGNIPWLDKFLT
jgi:hypothetical protein